MKIKKFLSIFLIFIILFFSFASVIFNVNAATDGTIIDKTKATKFDFNPIDVISWGAVTGAGNDSSSDLNSEICPFIPQDITEEMLTTKEAIALEGQSHFNDNMMDVLDAASIKSIIYPDTELIDQFYICQTLSEQLSVESKDIKIKYIVKMPSIEKEGQKVVEGKEPIEYYVENATIKLSEQEISNMDQIIMGYCKDVFVSNVFVDIDPSIKYGGTEEKWKEFSEEKIKSAYIFTTVSATAILPDGTEYSLVIGGNEEYKSNWYMIKTKDAKPVEPAPEPTPEPEPEKEFKTELNYKAYVDGKDIGGEVKEGTLYPGYDKEKVEKDADVTAIITSKTGNDIVQVNDKDLKSDGKPNEDGWYYIDVNNKKVIAKEYPFDKYDNLTDNGIVVEKGVKLTSVDGLDDTQDVSIKWPFRIIKVTQNPEKIEENTEKVRVEITTNLPIEEEKLPEGWKFTEDEEGKTQHRVYREFKKDENYDKDVILTANNRTDTDKTHVKIEWPKKEELPEEIPQTGSKNVVIIAGVLALITVAGASYKKFRK